MTIRRIAVEHEVEEQFLADILTTAVEGGITYWSEIIVYNWTEGPDHTRAEIAVDDEEDNAKRYRTVNLATIELGLRALLGGKVGVSSTILGYIAQGVAQGDAGAIDSDAADAIVQAGLFNEVVYG